MRNLPKIISIDAEKFRNKKTTPQLFFFYALRTLLGVGQEETPETVAHLVQDNWHNRAFAWRWAFTEVEADL
jgi:hypothetical protein